MVNRIYRIIIYFIVWEVNLNIKYKKIWYGIFSPIFRTRKLWNYENAAVEVQINLPRYTGRERERSGMA